MILDVLSGLLDGEASVKKGAAEQPLSQSATAASGLECGFRLSPFPGGASGGLPEGATSLCRSPEPRLLSRVLQVLFTPATQAARQAACTIVEALATIPSRKQQVLDLLTRCHLRGAWESGQPSPSSWGNL